MMRSSMIRLGAVLASLTALSKTAYAQDARDLGAAAPQVSATEGLEQKTPYWSAGKRRFFMGALFDIGGLFVRPEVDLGYGKPYYAWGGIEASTRLTLGGVSFSVGPRLSIPHLQMRAGLSSFKATDSYFLKPQTSYTRTDLDLITSPTAHYGSLDAEVLLGTRLGPGSVSLLSTLHGLIGMDKGYNVFSEAFHVVVKPPWLWSERVAYIFNVGALQDLGIGAVGEFIDVPKRGNAVTVRVGPAITVSLTHHLQATGAALIAVASRDNLGLAAADLGQIGIRYRWATGDLWPEFP